MLEKATLGVISSSSGMCRVYIWAPSRMMSWWGRVASSHPCTGPGPVMYWISKVISWLEQTVPEVPLHWEMAEVELIANGRAHRPYGEMSRLAPNMEQGLAQAVVEGSDTVDRYGIAKHGTRSDTVWVSKRGWNQLGQESMESSRFFRDSALEERFHSREIVSHTPLTYKIMEGTAVFYGN